MLFKSLLIKTSLILRGVLCYQGTLMSNRLLNGSFTYGNFMSDLFQHLLATKMSSTMVKAESECPFSCINEPRCYSLNIAAYPDSKGYYLCELLATDKYRAENELRANVDFHHFSLWTPCAKHPCLNGAACHPDYHDNTYQCICRHGYSGRHCEESEKWTKLNPIPVCYGARDDAYGTFTTHKAGSITRLALTHVSGSLTCTEEDPPTFWGCDNPTHFHKLRTLITFENKTRLLPAKVTNDGCSWVYSINGVHFNSTTLLFDPFANPLLVQTNETFQIWYGQDLQNCSEENNGGQICVDVLAWYS